MIIILKETFKTPKKDCFVWKNLQGVGSSGLVSCSSSSGRQGAESERDEVGGEDAGAPVLQSPFPPVVLRVCLGGDGDPVARHEAQVAGLLPREWMGRRDNQVPTGPAH